MGFESFDKLWKHLLCEPYFHVLWHGHIALITIHDIVQFKNSTQLVNCVCIDAICFFLKY